MLYMSWIWLLSIDKKGGNFYWTEGHHNQNVGWQIRRSFMYNVLLCSKLVQNCSQATKGVRVAYAYRLCLFFGSPKTNTAYKHSVRYSLNRVYLISSRPHHFWSYHTIVHGTTTWTDRLSNDWLQAGSWLPVARTLLSIWKDVMNIESQINSLQSSAKIIMVKT